MKQSLNYIVIVISSIFFYSCNHKTNDTENITNDNTLRFSSFAFNDSISKNIFSEEYINKEIEVTNFLVTYYSYNRDNSTCLIYCIPYDKKSNSYGAPMKGLQINSLNGNNINQVVVKNSHDYLIYLKDPKDLKKLKLFIPSEDFKSVGDLFGKYNKFTDLVNIKGEFIGIKDEYTVFKNAEILN